jgi:hypothetical protein
VPLLRRFLNDEEIFFEPCTFISAVQTRLSRFREPPFYQQNGASTAASGLDTTHLDVQPPAIPEVVGNITSSIVRPVFPIYTCIGVKTLTLAYRECPALPLAAHFKVRLSSIGTLIAYFNLLYHSSVAPSPFIGPINRHSHVALLQLPQGDPTKSPDLVLSSTRRYYGFLF